MTTDRTPAALAEEATRAALDLLNRTQETLSLYLAFHPSRDGDFMSDLLGLHDCPEGRKVSRDLANLTASLAASQAEPYAWFWQDGSESGVLTLRQDFEQHARDYPRMTFTPVWTAPRTKPSTPAPTQAAPVVQVAEAWQCRKPGGSWGPPFTKKTHVDAFLADGYEVRALGEVTTPLPQQAGEPQAAPVEAREGWISVEDRLPEPMTKVLAAFEMDRPGDWRISCASYEPLCHEFSIVAQGGWRIFGGGWTPSRWMHLPAAPQAEAWQAAWNRRATPSPAPAVDVERAMELATAWVQAELHIVIAQLQNRPTLLNPATDRAALRAHLEKTE